MFGIGGVIHNEPSVSLSLAKNLMGSWFPSHSGQLHFRSTSWRCLGSKNALIHEWKHLHQEAASPEAVLRSGGGFTRVVCCVISSTKANWNISYVYKGMCNKDTMFQFINKNIKRRLPSSNIKNVVNWYCHHSRSLLCKKKDDFTT